MGVELLLAWSNRLGGVCADSACLKWAGTVTGQMGVTLPGRGVAGVGELPSVERDIHCRSWERKKLLAACLRMS